MKAPNWTSLLKPYHLNLFMSNKYCYSQVKKVPGHHFVASANSAELKEQLTNRTADKEAAAATGALLAQRLKEKSILSVHWERPTKQKYHGKVRALVDSLRANGITLN